MVPKHFHTRKLSTFLTGQKKPLPEAGIPGKTQTSSKLQDPFSDILTNIEQISMLFRLIMILLKAKIFLWRNFDRGGGYAGLIQMGIKKVALHHLLNITS